MTNPNTAVASFLNTDAYEQIMGRWSRRLAPLLTVTEISMSAAGPAAWLPFTMGEGPQGQFVASLTETARATLMDHLRRAHHRQPA